MQKGQSRHTSVSRRSLIRKGGVIGAAGVTASLMTGCGGTSPGPARSDALATIRKRVEATPVVDTHEHLIEEEARLEGRHPRIKSNDWSFLLSHYLDSDLIASGMPEETYDAFFSVNTAPEEKWKLLAPYWPRVRETGYGQAVRIALERLYEVRELSAETVGKVQAGYERIVRPGFYRKVLQELGNIESCQVNFLDKPFSESRQPTLLMQDISILGMHMGPDIEAYAPAAGIDVKDLQDWHLVIDWWFDKYAPFAVAVKSQAAYSRNIDYADVPAERVEKVFRKKLNGEPVGLPEQKALEDHLFWYAVRKATEHDLPVKMHTGYYAGVNHMRLGRLQGNAAAASDLCRMSPDTRFVFMHIDYPFHSDLIAVAKHYTNCHLDMCWAWILSPVASVAFLKEYLVTAPANKVLTFGGDYIPVEPVLGHVTLARRGMTQALASLVDEGWLSLDSAVDLVEVIMRGNAREIFRLDEKTRRLQHPPWA